MLLNNEWVKNEIKEEIKKCQETRKNEHRTTQNLWDTTKDLYRLKVKGWKQIFQANAQERKAGVAILISDNIDFQKSA